MVLLAAEVAVVFGGGFEEFEAAVVELFAVFAELVELSFGEGFEVAEDFEVLVEDGDGVHAGDGSGDAGDAHGVAEGFGGGEGTVHDRFAGAGHGLHAEDGHAFLAGDGEDVALEGAIAGIERIDGELDGVEGEAAVQHFEVNAGVFVAGEADETDFAVFLGLRQGFEDTIGGVVVLGVVVVDDFVDLPDVEVVGLQAF